MAATIMRQAISRNQQEAEDAAGLIGPAGGVALYSSGQREDRRRLRSAAVSQASTQPSLFDSGMPPAPSLVGGTAALAQSKLVAKSGGGRALPVSVSMSTDAKENAKAQALRGKWRKPKNCRDMFKGKMSVFSPAYVGKRLFCVFAPGWHSHTLRGNVCVAAQVPLDEELGPTDGYVAFVHGIRNAV